MSKLKLDPEQILPLTLHLVLDRSDHQCEVDIECHHYEWTETSGVDLFEVVAGRLVRKASYNNVLSLHEVDPE